MDDANRLMRGNSRISQLRDSFHCSLENEADYVSEASPASAFVLKMGEVFGCEFVDIGFTACIGRQGLAAVSVQVDAS
jgi:hypothetical protein